MGRRVLITGVDHFWGGRVAQALERDPGFDVVIAMGTRDPAVALERTEFVRADQNYSILSRIVRATRVDTIVHTFMLLETEGVSPRALNETNVIGTMNLLAAAAAAHSSVRQVVVKSSSVVYGSSAEDPAVFREETARSHPASTRLERTLIDAEGYVNDFAEDNPHVIVTLLRYSNVLGSDIVTANSSNMRKGVSPYLLGFDPMIQFIEEDDVVRSLEFVVREELPGIYNVAGEGALPWSEVAVVAGTRRTPLPAIGTELFAWPLVRSGLLHLPPDLLGILRHGRTIDTRRLQEAGFTYRYSTAGAIESFAQANRLRKAIGRGRPAYRFEQDVEAFFRRSPAVVGDEG